jgi:hypothetical protein
VGALLDAEYKIARNSIDEDGNEAQHPAKYLSIAHLDREHIHPASPPMAFQFSLEDCELPQTIGKLRVFGTNAGCAHRCIKAAEGLLECVGVAFSQ